MAPLRSLGLLALSAALGCTALNPAYQDAESGGDGDGGAGADSSSTQEDTGSPTAGATTADPPTTTSSADSGTGEDELDWEFIDDERLEFEAGDLEGLRWEPSFDAVVIDGDDEQEGTLTSRIFETGGPVAELRGLEWAPPSPYGVGLFGPSVDETEYSLGGMDQQGLEFLLRFDELPATISAESLISDASGHANDGQLRGAALERIEGVFGNGVYNPGDGYVLHATASLAPGTDPFTWAVWYRHDSCEASSTFIAFDVPDAAAEGTDSVWMMCALGLQAAARYIDLKGAPTGPIVTGTTTLGDDVWHLAAVVLRRENGGTRLDLFVDGAHDGSDSYEGQFDFAYGMPQLFSTLGNPDTLRRGTGDYDEVMVWRLALTEAELLSLFRRGATSLELRVRACMVPDCSDEPPFRGPRPGEPFRDSGPHENHAHDLHPLGLHGVAFQYQVEMKARVGTPSPRLPRVRLTAALWDGD